MAQPTSEQLSDKRDEPRKCDHWWELERSIGSWGRTYQNMYRCRRCLETKWIDSGQVAYD